MGISYSRIDYMYALNWATWSTSTVGDAIVFIACELLECELFCLVRFLFTLWFAPSFVWCVHFAFWLFADAPDSPDVSSPPSSSQRKYARVFSGSFLTACRAPRPSGYDQKPATFAACPAKRWLWCQSCSFRRSYAKICFISRTSFSVPQIISYAVYQRPNASVDLLLRIRSNMGKNFANFLQPLSKILHVYSKISGKWGRYCQFTAIVWVWFWVLCHRSEFRVTVAPWLKVAVRESTRSRACGSFVTVPCLCVAFMLQSRVWSFEFRARLSGWYAFACFFSLKWPLHKPLEIAGFHTRYHQKSHEDRSTTSSTRVHFRRPRRSVVLVEKVRVRTCTRACVCFVCRCLCALYVRFLHHRTTYRWNWSRFFTRNTARSGTKCIAR